MEPLSQEEAWVLEEKYGGTRTSEFEADARRLALGEPAAYVIGYQPFLGLKIYLDSHPLIPRPETEWWTEQLLEAIRDRSVSERAERDGASQSKISAEIYAAPKPTGFGRPIRFLDLCAGSGAIGCAALDRLPDAEVYFGELDPAHEASIRKNIRENVLDESRAHVGIGDLFAPFGDMKFDVIAANPPYIPSERALPENVAKFEPHTALFGGADGLELIRRIAADLPKHISPGGIAWIECDAEHADAARELFIAAGFSATIMHDQYERPRVLVLSFP